MSKEYIKLFLLENITYLALALLFLSIIGELNDILLWICFLIIHFTAKETRSIIREIKNEKSERFKNSMFLSIIILCGIIVYIISSEISIYHLVFMVIPILYLFNELKGYPNYIKNNWDF